MYSLLARNSKLKLRQKLNTYTYLLKPIWTYALQIYGTAKKTHIRKLQTFQSKTFRAITKAPWYVSNITLHKDLQMPTVNDHIRTYYKRFHNNLHGHTNSLIRGMATTNMPDSTRRRLKRSWMRDLLH